MSLIIIKDKINKRRNEIIETASLYFFEKHRKNDFGISEFPTWDIDYPSLEVTIKSVLEHSLDNTIKDWRVYERQLTQELSSLRIDVKNYIDSEFRQLIDDVNKSIFKFGDIERETYLRLLAKRRELTKDEVLIEINKDLTDLIANNEFFEFFPKDLREKWNNEKEKNAEVLNKELLDLIDDDFNEILDRFALLKDLSKRVDFSENYNKVIEKSFQKAEKQLIPKEFDHISQYFDYFQELNSLIEEIEEEIKKNGKFFISFNPHFLPILWNRLEQNKRELMLNLLGLKNYRRKKLLKIEKHNYQWSGYEEFIDRKEFKKGITEILKNKQFKLKYAQEINKASEEKSKSSLREIEQIFWEEFTTPNMREEIISELKIEFNDSIRKWNQLIKGFREKIIEQFIKIKKNTLILKMGNGIENVEMWYEYYLFDREEKDGFFLDIIKDLDDPFKFPEQYNKIGVKDWDGLDKITQDKLKLLLINMNTLFSQDNDFFIELYEKLRKDFSDNLKTELEKKRSIITKQINDLKLEIYQAIYGLYTKQEGLDKLNNDLDTYQKISNDQKIFFLTDSYIYEKEIKFAQETIDYLDRKFNNLDLIAFIQEKLGVKLSKIVNSFTSVSFEVFLEFSKSKNHISFTIEHPSNILLANCIISSKNLDSLSIFKDFHIYTSLVGLESLFDLEIEDVKSISVLFMNIIKAVIYLKSGLKFSKSNPFLSKNMTKNKYIKGKWVDIDLREEIKLKQIKYNDPLVFKETFEPTVKDFKLLFKDFTKSSQGKLLGRVGSSNNYLTDYETEIFVNSNEIRILKRSEQDHLYTDTKISNFRNNNLTKNHSHIYYIDQLRDTFGGLGNVIDSIFDNSDHIRLSLSDEGILKISFDFKIGNLAINVYYLIPPKKKKSFVEAFDDQDLGTLIKTISEMKNEYQIIKNEILSITDYNIKECESSIKKIDKKLSNSEIKEILSYNAKEIIIKYPYLKLKETLTDLALELLYIKAIYKLINEYRKFLEVLKFIGLTEEDFPKIKRRIEDLNTERENLEEEKINIYEEQKIINFYWDLTISDLRRIAREKGVRGIDSQSRKGEIIDRLITYSDEHKEIVNKLFENQKEIDHIHNQIRLINEEIPKLKGRIQNSITSKSSFEKGALHNWDNFVGMQLSKYINEYYIYAQIVKELQEKGKMEQFKEKLLETYNKFQSYDKTKDEVLSQNILIEIRNDLEKLIKETNIQIRGV